MSFGNILYSCIARQSAAIQYRLGMFVWPRTGNGPLAVFGTLAQAKRFAGDSFDVWECDYRPSKHAGLFLTEEDQRKELSHMMTPMGTRYADSVKLIRRCS